MVKFGADEIFRSNESTISEDDIDVIMRRSEDRTREQNERIQSNVAKLSSKLTFDGRFESTLAQTADLYRSAFSGDDGALVPEAADMIL